MNRTQIDWTDFTWNPITGCLHGCSYCYCRDIVKRFGLNSGGGLHPLAQGNLHIFNEPKTVIRKEERLNDPYPYGFKPTFHRYRLDEPKKRKKPAKIFVCSMADLFGKWVPDEWIEEVLDVIRECPQHTFQLLTKGPTYQLCHFDFPKNAWIGITIDGHYRTIDGFPNGCNAKVKFVSFEPLLNEIGYFPADANWFIIGSQTGPNARKPKMEWVQGILEHAKENNIPVFVKDNLIKIYPELKIYKEFPIEMDV